MMGPSEFSAENQENPSVSILEQLLGSTLHHVNILRPKYWDSDVHRPRQQRVKFYQQLLQTLNLLHKSHLQNDSQRVAFSIKHMIIVAYTFSISLQSEYRLLITKTHLQYLWDELRRTLTELLGDPYLAKSKMDPEARLIIYSFWDRLVDELTDLKENHIASRTHLEEKSDIELEIRQGFVDTVGIVEKTLEPLAVLENNAPGHRHGHRFGSVGKNTHQRKVRIAGMDQTSSRFPFSVTFFWATSLWYWLYESKLMVDIVDGHQREALVSSSLKIEEMKGFLELEEKHAQSLERKRKRELEDAAIKNEGRRLTVFIDDAWKEFVLDLDLSDGGEEAAVEAERQKWRRKSSSVSQTKWLLESRRGNYPFFLPTGM